MRGGVGKATSEFENPKAAEPSSGQNLQSTIDSNRIARKTGKERQLKKESLTVQEPEGGLEPEPEAH